MYSDLWEPSPIKSINGARYFILFVDDYTKYCWIYLLQSKLDVLSTFLQFKVIVENQFNTTIKALQSDGGTEFKPLSPVLISNGIVHRISCPYTPQQNESVERKTKHMV